MTVNIKLNTWLWLLCGRSTGFKSDILNTGIAYGTPQANPDVVEARALLHLGDTRTDFHVFGAMAAALEIAQALRILPEDHSTVFNPSVYHDPSGNSGTPTAQVISLTAVGDVLYDGSVRVSYARPDHAGQVYVPVIAGDAPSVWAEKVKVVLESAPYQDAFGVFTITRDGDTLHFASTEIEAVLDAYVSYASNMTGVEASTSIITAEASGVATPPLVGAVAAPPSPSRWPSLRNFPRALPAATAYTVTKSGQQAVVVDDLGTVERYSYQAFGDTILVPGLRGIGIDAAFVVPSWTDGDSFTITIPPTRYPFAAVAAAITSPTLIALMSNAGTLEAFAATTDPVRRVGALACAIMLEQYRRSISALPITVSAAVGDVLDFAAAEFVNDQLAIDWSPILLEGAPVTYDDDSYDPGDV